MAKEPTTSSTGEEVIFKVLEDYTVQKIYRHCTDGNPAADITDFILKKDDYTNTFIVLKIEGVPDGVMLYLIDENSNQLYSPVDINGNWVTTRCSATVGSYTIIPLPAQFNDDLSNYTSFPAGIYNWKLKFTGNNEYIEREIPLNIEIRDFKVWEILTPQIYPNENVQAKLRTYGDTVYPDLAEDSTNEDSRYYYDLSYILSSNATYNNSTGIITYPSSDIDTSLGEKKFMVNQERKFSIDYEVMNPIVPYIGDSPGENNQTSFHYEQNIYFSIYTDKERTGGFCNTATRAIEIPDITVSSHIKIESNEFEKGPFYLPKNAYNDNSCPSLMSIPDDYISTKFPPSTYDYALYGIYTSLCRQGYNAKKQFIITTQDCELKIAKDNIHLKSTYMYSRNIPIGDAKIGLLKDNSLVKTAYTDSSGEILWNIESGGVYTCVAIDTYDNSYMLHSSNSVDVFAASDIIITPNKNALSYIDNDVLTLSAKPVDSSGNTAKDIDVVFKKDDEVLSTTSTDTSGVAQCQYMSRGEGDVTFTIEAAFNSKTYTIEDVFCYKTEEEITQEWTKYTLPGDRYVYKTPLMLTPDDNFTLEYRYNTIGRAVDGVDLCSENYNIKLGNVYDKNTGALQSYCSNTSSHRNRYYGATPNFNTTSIYKIKLSNDRATWYDNDTVYEESMLIETTPTPVLRHDIFVYDTSHLDYVKLKTNYEILYDDLTKASNYWDIPSNVMAGSQYSQDGWSIHSSSGYQQIKNKIIIPSENVEISFTYMGGYTSSTLANIIAIFYKESNENTNIGWISNGTTFEFYQGNGRKTNYPLKIGDRVVFKYNNGKADTIVNNTLIDTYNYDNRSITNSHLELHTHDNRGVQLKDLKIKFRPQRKEVYYSDPMTSESGDWNIPSAVQSSYSSDGWLIKTNSSNHQRIKLESYPILTETFEIQYTYGGGVTGNTVNQMIEFSSNDLIVLGIRYAPSTQLFEIYTGGDAFYTTIGPVNIKIGDIITHQYDVGNIIIKVNNNIVGICYNYVPDIVNSIPMLIVRNDKWWKLKDFTITTVEGQNEYSPEPTVPEPTVPEPTS